MVADGAASENNACWWRATLFGFVETKTSLSHHHHHPSRKINNSYALTSSKLHPILPFAVKTRYVGTRYQNMWWECRSNSGSTRESRSRTGERVLSLLVAVARFLFTKRERGRFSFLSHEVKKLLREKISHKIIMSVK